MTSSPSNPDVTPMVVPRPLAELLPSDEYSQYLLTSKAEKFAICRGLAEHVSQISMIFNEGHDMVLTSLISWDDHGLVFDVGPSAEMNQKALQAQKLFCSAQLDKVEIQFILRGLDRIEVDGRAAFHTALPESILRLQRREFFRLITPVAHPLICRMCIDGAMLDAHVADLSIGGVLLAGLPLEFPPDTGAEFPGCSIELPDVGAIEATLCQRWQAETVTRSGIRGKRAGFEFVRLPQVKATLIQRYIIKTERERKARAAGTA